MVNKKIAVILVAWVLLFTVASAVNADTIEKIKNSVGSTVKNGFSFSSESSKVILSGSGGSDDSTGGKGVVTCENLSNILKTQTSTGNIRKDTITSFTFQEFSIFKLYANGKDNADTVSVRIELINGLSSCIKEDTPIPIPGEVYQYINVWIGEPVIKELKAKLRLDKTAFVDSDVGIYQWNKTKKEWVLLETTSVGEDINYNYFDVMTNGEGNFAIIKMRPMSASPVQMITTEPIPTITSSSTERFQMPALGIFLVVLLLVGIFIFRTLAKKGKKKDK